MIQIHVMSSDSLPELEKEVNTYLEVVTDFGYRIMSAPAYTSTNYGLFGHKVRHSVTVTYETNKK